MKVNEYGAWPLWNESTGGQKPSFDPYNRHLKKERFPRAEEYASRGIEGYHHYSEYNDFTSANKKADSAEEKKRKEAQRARAARQRILQQVVCLVAGSTIIVSTYQAVTKQQQQQEAAPTSVVSTDEQNNVLPTEPVLPDEDDVIVLEPDEIVPQQEPENPTVPQEAAAPIVASTKWNWSEDNKTATIVLLDGSGNVIKEVSAQVSVSQTAPTCNKDGIKTYTATAENDGETYSDTHSETLKALGHSFGNGKEVTLKNGNKAMVFECSRCHEKFTVETSATEND